MAIDKKTVYCMAAEKSVEAIVEEVTKGRGKNAETTQIFLNCMDTSDCNKESYCKFINPLSTRCPLAMSSEEETLESPVAG
ncbi:MAG: hypothetical protein ACYTGH_05730 [Planctomycetota bacterium]|jgi:hypothetical protein